MTEDLDERLSLEYEERTAQLRAQIARGAGYDRDLIEDVLQETWWRAVRSWRRLGVPDSPAAWLATVARNILRNEFRRRQFVPLVDEHHTLADNSLSADPSSALEVAERETELHRAIRRLAPADADLLTSFYSGQTSVAALAARLGISDRAVEGRLRRARKKLRIQLVDHRFGASGLGRMALLGILGPRSRQNAALTGTGAMSLLPLLPIIALAPLAFLFSRMNRDRLAALRITAGVLLVSVSATYGATAARPEYARVLQLVGLMLALWGLAMLLRRQVSK